MLRYKTENRPAVWSPCTTSDQETERVNSYNHGASTGCHNPTVISNPQTGPRDPQIDTVQICPAPHFVMCPHKLYKRYAKLQVLKKKIQKRKRIS